jgi:uncharacterized protein with beta-barrel porin domain
MVSIDRNDLTNFNYALYDVIESGQPSTGAAVAAKDGEVRVWAAPFGSVNNVGNEGVGFNVKTAGLIGGVEYRLTDYNATIGVAASYSKGWVDVDNEDTSAGKDTYNVALYGGADVQNARIDGTFFYNSYSSSIKRDLGSNGTAKSSPDGFAWGGSVQVSRSLFGDLITPYVRGVFARVHQDAVTETGADLLALKYDALNYNTFVSDLGFRIHVVNPTPDDKTQVEVKLAIEHDFSDAGEKVTGAFAELTGSSFTYKWDGNNANALLVGVEYGNEVIDGLNIYARLNGRFTTDQRAGDLTIGARYRF